VLTLYAQQVLGYSAVKFGLTSLVFPVMAAAGSIVGQSIVLRVGFRRAAAAGMALMGAGALLLPRVSVGGSYFGDIFFGLLVFGPASASPSSPPRSPPSPAFPSASQGSPPV
jgi:hypothetical protein